MESNQRTDKKLKAGVTLFFISLVGIVIGVVVFALDIAGIVDKIGDADVTIRMVTAALFVVGIVLLAISVLLNASYRKSCAVPGKLSTVIYVTGWILLLPVMIIVLVAALLGGANLSVSNELKRVTIKDEKGNVYNLTQTFIGSNEYRDQNGDLWRTADGGRTFGRVDVKAMDSDGNERTLTPTYDDALTKHYRDRDGQEWKSRDGGLTLEHVVTEAKVTDKDGNEYSLRAIQAGLDNFIDQNGDTWTTHDGGKTFERR